MIEHYSHKIQNAIQQELFKAKESIKIAVAWFTNELLLQPLILKLQNGVLVELIINDDEINRNGETSLDFTEFLKAGGVLRWNDSKQLMHEKFCIIDNRIVITGSYNWTNKAEYNSEVENIFYDEDETTLFYNELYNKLSVRFEKEVYVDNGDNNEIPEAKSYYDEDGFFIDEFGAKYSNDKKLLIKVPGDELVFKSVGRAEELHLSGKCPTSYHIPDGVVAIEDGAFAVCTCLKDVYIPNTVTYIGIGAFSECRALTSIRIPDSIKRIGRGAFYNSGLESIRIPDRIKMISEGTFEYCKSLASVQISNSVTAIGDSAFAFCTDLKSVKIPDSVISIGKRAFSNCRKLVSIDMSNNINAIEDCTFYGCESLVTCHIPDSVTTIGKEAFCSCKKFRSVIIPDKVKSIGDQAFGYTDLVSVNFPKSVPTIGKAVLGNTLISTVYVPAGTKDEYIHILSGMSGVKIVEYYGMDDLLKIVYDYELEDAWTDEFGAKYSHDKKRLLKGPTNGISNYSIRNGTKVICNEAFYCSYKLNSICIPDTVTCVGNRAFSGCTGLTAINIPDSVSNIGSLAFNGCVNLVSIRLPNNLTSMGNVAFGNCKAINSIKIPGSVIRIGRAIFVGCDKLSTVYIPAGSKNKYEVLLLQYKDKIVEQ